ncbi:MAG TPA: response regulator, partial [Burkholderiaceae bacterium]|nr:response regulator [Burkholderiaceae bacterium]
LLYNDAFRASLGDRHPQALGEPAQIVWGEAWRRLEPQLSALRDEGPLEATLGTGPLSFTTLPDAPAGTLLCTLGDAAGDSVWAALDAAHANPGESRPRVLVAGDDPVQCEQVRRMLERGYEVHVTSDSEQALDAARVDPPDLLLVQAALRGHDALAIVRELRADERTAWLPVIMLPSRAGTPARADCVRAGADDVLGIPLSARELMTRTAAAMKVARVRREAMQREAQLKAETASVLDSIGEGFVSLDAEMRMRYVNAAAERLYRIDRREALGRTPWEVMPWLQSTPLERELRRVLERRQPAHFELGQPPGDRFFEVHAYPLRDGLAAYLRDISLRKESERRLRDEVRLSETLSRISRILATELDIVVIAQSVVDGASELTGAVHAAFFYTLNDASGDGTMLRVVSALPGVPRERVVGEARPGDKALLDATFGADAAAVRADDVKREERQVAALPFGGSSGKPQSISSYLAVPVIRGTKGVIGGLFLGHPEAGVFTERHAELVAGVAAQAAVAIDKSRFYHRLRDTADRLSLALSAAGLGDWSWDATSDLVTMSERAAEIFGIPPGPSMTWTAMQQLLHEDDRAAAHEAVIRSAGTGERYSAEYRVRRPTDGVEVWVLASGMPQRETAERGAGMLGVVQDITAAKQMERELRERARELAEADRRKDEFLATLAHELRNPLAPLRNSLEILRRAGNNERLRDQAQSIMGRQVIQMVRLIDELIDISRITSGKIELKCENVPLRAVVDSALEIARPLIDERQQKLEVELPPEPLHLHVDRTRMAQVLSNLLHNAAKYSDAQGHIVLRAQRLTDGDLVIAVRDRGVGLAPDMLPKVFEMFVQVGRPLSPGQVGLGVGLTLARRLAELHGGSLHAYSEGLGCGSEFVIRLPARCVLEHAPAAVTGAAQVETPSAFHRVLVVDDNVDAAESLAALLKPDGHEVEVVHDAQEALASVRRFEPDVVLLDIGLPGMDGYEVARRIRQAVHGVRVTLVATTGWGQQKDRDRSRDAGFDHHLVKPVDPQAIRRLLADLPPAASRLPAPGAGSSMASSGEDMGPGRVLVADDNELVRESFVQLLRSEGYEVRTAIDGLQAVKVAEEWHPQVVLLDIHMPRLNGLDTARRLRASHPSDEMTLLMMSGMSLNEHWIKLAKSAGFDDCIDKTSDPQTWLGRLQDRRPTASAASGS